MFKGFEAEDETLASDLSRVKELVHNWIQNQKLDLNKQDYFKDKLLTFIYSQANELYLDSSEYKKLVDNCLEMLSLKFTDLSLAEEELFPIQKIETVIKTDRIKSKNQLIQNINRIHKKDQELSKRRQKIPIEIYRTIEILFKTLKKR